jgi:biotin operon repressor
MICNMNEVELIEQLSFPAAKLYLFLTRAGKTEFSSDALGKRLGMSRGLVERAKKDLRSCGLVETDKASKVTGFYLPYDVSNTVQYSLTQSNTVHSSTASVTLDKPQITTVEAALDRLEVKERANDSRVSGGHGSVLRAYKTAFPKGATPAHSVVQQWLNQIPADILISMLERMALSGKEIASPIGYVRSAVAAEAAKRKEHDLPSGEEQEANIEEVIAIQAAATKVMHKSAEEYERERKENIEAGRRRIAERSNSRTKVS